MNTKIIILYHARITVTKHQGNDFSIDFESEFDDYSVHCSTMLGIIMAFAEWQQSVLEVPVISFEHDGIEISDPWKDVTGRFPLDSSQACDRYGDEKVMQFIIDACTLLRPDEKND